MLKDELQLLPLALYAVRNGSTVYPRRVTDLSARVPALTEREAEILHLLPSGPTTADLMECLRLSQATVKRVIAGTCAKFEVSGRAELIRIAIELGYPTKLESAGRRS